MIPIFSPEALCFPCQSEHSVIKGNYRDLGRLKWLNRKMVLIVHYLTLASDVACYTCWQCCCFSTMQAQDSATGLDLDLVQR